MEEGGTRQYTYVCPFTLLTINEHVLCAFLSYLSFQSHSNIDQIMHAHIAHESCMCLLLHVCAFQIGNGQRCKTMCL